MFEWLFHVADSVIDSPGLTVWETRNMGWIPAFEVHFAAIAGREKTTAAGPKEDADVVLACVCLGQGHDDRLACAHPISPRGFLGCRREGWPAGAAGGLAAWFCCCADGPALAGAAAEPTLDPIVVDAPVGKHALIFGNRISGSWPVIAVEIAVIPVPHDRRRRSSG